MTATISGAATDQRLLCSAIERHGVSRVFLRVVRAAQAQVTESGCSWEVAVDLVIDLLIGEQREWEAGR